MPPCCKNPVSNNTNNFWKILSGEFEINICGQHVSEPMLVTDGEHTGSGEGHKGMVDEAPSVTKRRAQLAFVREQIAWVVV